MVTEVYVGGFAPPEVGGGSVRLITTIVITRATSITTATSTTTIMSIILIMALFPICFLP